MINIFLLIGCKFQMLDDSPLAALVDYQKPHVTAFMEDCQNDVKYCVESSVKLFNCMADVKLFQKSCVVLDNVDRAR
jgi:hypothetical protein